MEIEDFFIDVNEVTCRYWSEFIRDTQRKPPKNWHEKKEKRRRASRGRAVRVRARRPSGDAPSRDDYDPPPGMENLPVTMITLDDIEMYLAWCGRRLPTEFEWEAAARAKAPGDKSARWWPWGDTYDRNERRSATTRRR